MASCGKHPTELGGGSEHSARGPVQLGDRSSVNVMLWSLGLSGGAEAGNHARVLVLKADVLSHEAGDSAALDKIEETPIFCPAGACFRSQCRSVV
jgi:hypothetical protein